MLERFSRSARRAAVHAQEEARALCHPHIGVEHLLLSLLSNKESSVAVLLERQGVTYEHVLSEVENRHPAGTRLVQDPILFDPQTRLAMQTARTIGNPTDNINPPVRDLHLLLSLFCIDDTTASDILEKLNCDQRALCNAAASTVGVPAPFAADRYKLPDIVRQRQEVWAAIDNASTDQLRTALTRFTVAMPGGQLNKMKKDLTE